MENFDGKSSVDEIRARFDADVERFSNLETGQTSTVDAAISLELIAQAAAASLEGKKTRRALDIGCGAGNLTLKLGTLCHGFDADLLDLSGNMLTRAKERVSAASKGTVRTFQGDFRETDLDPESYDVILAAAVLHHLRGDDDWQKAFAKIFSLCKKGGSVWISDLVSHEDPEVEKIMRARYAQYLTNLGGAEYCKKVLEYVEREDSPRPLTYQLELLKSSGFDRVEVLHKNSCFAAFGAYKL